MSDEAATIDHPHFYEQEPQFTIKLATLNFVNPDQRRLIDETQKVVMHDSGVSVQHFDLKDVQQNGWSEEVRGATHLIVDINQAETRGKLVDLIRVLAALKDNRRTEHIAVIAYDPRNRMQDQAFREQFEPTGTKLSQLTGTDSEHLLAYNDSLPLINSTIGDISPTDLIKACSLEFPFQSRRF